MCFGPRKRSFVMIVYLLGRISFHLSSSISSGILWFYGADGKARALKALVEYGDGIETYPLLFAPVLISLRWTSKIIEEKKNCPT